MTRLEHFSKTLFFTFPISPNVFADHKASMTRCETSALDNPTLQENVNPSYSSLNPPKANDIANPVDEERRILNVVVQELLCGLLNEPQRHRGIYDWVEAYAYVMKLDERHFV